MNVKFTMVTPQGQRCEFEAACDSAISDQRPIETMFRHVYGLALLSLSKSSLKILVHVPTLKKLDTLWER